MSEHINASIKRQVTQWFEFKNNENHMLWLSDQNRNKLNKKSNLFVVSEALNHSLLLSWKWFSCCFVISKRTEQLCVLRKATRCDCHGFPTKTKTFYAVFFHASSLCTECV